MSPGWARARQESAHGKASIGCGGARAGTTYSVDIRHQGKSVTSFRNRAKVTEIAEVGSRTGGHITLFVHSNEVIRITELTIEGVLDGKRLDGVRRTWVKAKLTQLFEK